MSYNLMKGASILLRWNVQKMDGPKNFDWKTQVGFLEALGWH